MAASNTKDCFRECIGKKVVGVLFDALPVGRADLSAGTRTLVFDDGTGLTVSANGSFWLETASDIRTAVTFREIDLRNVEREIKEVLAVAGVTAKEEPTGAPV